MAYSLPASPVGPVLSPNFNASVQQGSQIYLVMSIPGQGTVPVGYVQRVDQSDAYNAEGFYGIGHIEPFEIQDLQFTGQLTVTGGKLYTGSWLGPNGIFREAGQILSSGALNVMVYNLVLQKPEITYVGFVVQNYTVAYAANAYTIQTMTGLYRTILIG